MTEIEIQSAHFKPAEVKCRCCGLYIPNWRLFQCAEIFRTLIGNKRMGVLSGCRCEARNRAVGGAQNSQHLYGRALDLYSPDADWDTQDPAMVQTAIAAGFTGIGQGAGKFHVDTRPLEEGQKPIIWRYER